MAGNPYTWSTTAATNSSADADINFAEGQLPGTLNDSCRGAMAGVAGWLKDTNSTLTTGGSANAQTVTSNIGYAALATGIRLHLKAGFSSTATGVTLNLTPAGGAAFGAKAIKIITGAGEIDPIANSIRLNGHYVVEYDAAANAAAGAWILLNPVPATVGQILQTSSTTYTANTALTTVLPVDNTIPQVTEGTQILSLAITPSSSTSKIRLQGHGWGAIGTDAVGAAYAVFSSQSANAIQAGMFFSSDSFAVFQGFAFFVEHSPATTSAVTYSVRVGPGSAATIRLNGDASAARFGGAAASYLIAQEIQQ